MREMVAHAGAINAVAQQLLKLTAPGCRTSIREQNCGTRVWSTRIIAARSTTRDAPASCEDYSDVAGRRLAAELLETKADGRIKLYLTSRVLACRAAYPDLFARGDYIPLAAEGAAADHVVAFARRDAENEFIVVVPRLVVGLIGKELRDPIGPKVWGDTRCSFPTPSQARATAMSSAERRTRPQRATMAPSCPSGRFAAFPRAAGAHFILLGVHAAV